MLVKQYYLYCNRRGEGMKKYFVIICILVALAVCICALTACNDNTNNNSNPPATSDGLVYTLSADETSYSVSGYNGTGANVAIPATYNGKPVTAIGERAFAGKDDIDNITIADSVTSIGKEAFYLCDARIEWGKNPAITDIGDYAFFFYKGTGMTLPGTVDTIGKWAFGRSSVARITFPSNLKKIDDYAFVGCSGITELFIPRTVQEFGKGIFIECSSVETFVTPFLGKTVDVSSNADLKYFFSDGKADVPFSLKKVRILTGTKIGDNAFSGCNHLTSIEIPDGITSIGDSAFSNCSSLESFDLPDGITSIGDSAFSNCSSLQSLDLPDSVTEIGSYALAGIEIKTITIPAKVKEISESLFSSAKIENVVLHNDIIAIKDNAFSYCKNLKSISIPSSVQSIGDWAFSNCATLKTITIPSSVQSIGSHAFNNCSALLSVSISDGAKSIEYNAFAGCTSLSSINLPSGTKTDGIIFNGCTSLTSIVIGKDISKLSFSTFYSSDITDAFYCGTEEELQPYKYKLEELNIWFYSESKPTETGQFWHYVDGIAVKWETTI